MALGGLTESLGLDNINVSGILDNILLFAGLFFLILVVGVALMGWYILNKKRKKKKDTKKIGWWVDVNGRMEPTSMDDAEEIIIPGTTLRIFYVKDRDLWLPLFTRGVTKDLFYVLLTPNRQMVNWTPKSLTKDLKEANLDYDHTDMLWAAENAREYIKKNYQDKSEKWWQKHATTIAIAALLIVMTFSFVIIIYFMRGMVQDLGVVSGTISEAVKTSCANAQTSGVVTVP